MQHNCICYYICNMPRSKSTSKLDNIGMTASVLCAVHCAIVPLLLTSLPLFGLGFLANPWVEWSMIIFALGVGFYVIGSSYFNIHRKLLPMCLLIVGFLIIIGGHLFITSWREAIIVPIGGLLIATAHFFNFRYTGICRHENNRFHLKYGHHV